MTPVLTSLRLHPELLKCFSTVVLFKPMMLLLVPCPPPGLASVHGDRIQPAPATGLPFQAMSWLETFLRLKGSPSPMAIVTIWGKKPLRPHFPSLMNLTSHTTQILAELRAQPPGPARPAHSKQLQTSALCNVSSLSPQLCSLARRQLRPSWHYFQP